MKNVKLTLAATISALVMTFSGSAFADGMDRQHYKKGFKAKPQVTKQVSKRGFKKISKRDTRQLSKKVKHQTFKHSNKRKVIKRVIIKKMPGKKVIITKKIIKKRVPTRYVMNKRFKQGKKYNKRAGYKNRRHTKHRHARFKTPKPHKRFVYSVRPGDTLYRISSRTGVSIHKLVRMNRLKHGRANYLRVGQLLRLA